MTDAIDMASLRDQPPRAPRMTLCLGGPLHGMQVHVDRAGFRCASPSDGEHEYKRVAFRADGGSETLYVLAALSDDAAMSLYLAWRGLS